jgi:hypothetical protein
VQIAIDPPGRTGAVTLMALGWLACTKTMEAPAGPNQGPPDAPLESDVASEVLPATPQRPPRGQAAIESWLAEGHHRSWRCETGVSPMRLTGNHGRHRICSNDLLLSSPSGPYPVGAASVKELFLVGEQPNGFAVGLKIEEGLGAHTWYWYERRGAVASARPLAQGIGVPDCAVCHGTAPRDNVFFQAP